MIMAKKFKLAFIFCIKFCRAGVREAPTPGKLRFPGPIRRGGRRDRERKKISAAAGSFLTRFFVI